MKYRVIKTAVCNSDTNYKIGWVYDVYSSVNEAFKAAEELNTTIFMHSVPKGVRCSCHYDVIEDK